MRITNDTSSSLRITKEVGKLSSPNVIGGACFGGKRTNDRGEGFDDVNEDGDNTEVAGFAKVDEGTGSEVCDIGCSTIHATAKLGKWKDGGNCRQSSFADNRSKGVGWWASDGNITVIIDFSRGALRFVKLTELRVDKKRRGNRAGSNLEVERVEGTGKGVGCKSKQLTSKTFSGKGLGFALSKLPRNVGVRWDKRWVRGKGGCRGAVFKLVLGEDVNWINSSGAKNMLEMGSKHFTGQMMCKADRQGR